MDTEQSVYWLGGVTGKNWNSTLYTSRDRKHIEVESKTTQETICFHMWTKDKLSQGVDYWSIYPLQYEYIIIISLTVTLRPHQERALNTMKTNPKGQIIVPTGGGKTMVMIEHASYMFCQNAVPKTIVVVAPRILLANQLCSEYL